MNASLDLSVLAVFQPGSHFTQQQVPLLFPVTSVGTDRPLQSAANPTCHLHAALVEHPGISWDGKRLCMEDVFHWHPQFAATSLKGGYDFVNRVFFKKIYFNFFPKRGSWLGRIIKMNLIFFQWALVSPPRRLKISRCCFQLHRASKS